MKIFRIRFGIFRILFGVVLGYVAIALIVMVGMTVGAVVLGGDWVFVGESWQPSGLWNAFAMTLNVVAAFFGGVTAAWWGGRSIAGYGLAVVIVVFGFITMLAIENRQITMNPPPRPIKMELSDWWLTEQYAKPPSWMLASSPVCGAAGVIVGTLYLGRRKGRPAANQPRIV